MPAVRIEIDGAAEQTYLYVADGSNQKIHVLTSFGDGGRQPAEFYAVDSIATDSNGNIFTTVYRGLGPV